MIGRARVGQGLLALALMALIGWPLLATAWQAATERIGRPTAEADAKGSSPTPGAGAPAAWYLGARPLSLARNTAALVGLTLLIAMPPGVALGWLLFRTDVLGGRVLLAVLGLALFVPMPLNALAWLGSFGNAGRSPALAWMPVLAGLRGAAWVHAMAALPWVVFVAGVGMTAVEPELEESARMDLPAWKVAIVVTLRRSIGAIAGAALVVAVLTAGDMTVTDLLQVRTYAEEAYIQAQLTMGQGAAAAAATVPMMAALGAMLLVAAGVLLRADPARLPSAEGRAPAWPLGRWRAPLGLAAMATVGNLAALPIYGLIWRAGRVGPGRPPSWSLSGLIGSLQRAWPDLISAQEGGPWYATLDSRPLLATIFWSATAATLSASLAWPMAWMARKPGIWRWAVAASVALLLAAPGPIVGEALKRAYLPVAIVHDTPALMVLAYVARTLPYALLLLWPAVRAIPAEHLDAARLDGWDAWGRFVQVGFPLTRGAIAAAWGVSFVLAMGELPAANFTANAGRWPAALEVWRLLHTGVESRLASVGLILLAGVAVAGTGAMGAVAMAYKGRG